MSLRTSAAIAVAITSSLLTPNASTAAIIFIPPVVIAPSAPTTAAVPSPGAGGGGGGGGAWIAGGIVGVAGSLAAFSDQGFVTKMCREGGFRVRVEDVDHVPGAREWLEDHGTPAEKRALRHRVPDEDAVRAMEMRGNHN